jgi:hypothetical protein
MTLAFSHDYYPEPEEYHRPDFKADDVHGYPGDLVSEVRLAQIQYLRWIGFPLTEALAEEESALEASLGVPHTEPAYQADKLWLSGEPYVINYIT